MFGRMTSTRRVAGPDVAPGALPVLGHAVQFFRDPLAFLRTAQQAGDVVSVRLGPTRAYLVCAPNLVQQVLKNPKVFDKGGSVYDAFRVTFGDGVGACPFESHRRKRHLVQPALHRNRMAGYGAMMSEQAAAMVDGWRPGQALDVDVAMHRLTTTAALRMLFASRVTGEVVAEMHALLPSMMRGLYRRAMIPVAPLHAVPTPENRRYRTARRRVHGLVDELLASPSTEDDAAVSALRASGLTGAELHDEVMGLLVGGVETTVATLCWAFVLLDQDQALRDRLHAEVDHVLDGRPAGYDDLARLDYTGRVVTEVLRLYPPVWVLTRQVAEDTELAGHPVPAGATVMFSPYALHHDPRLYDTPETFDPDRWLPDPAATVPQGAWIPFGAGNRKCIGDVFATVEATIALATVSARWRLSSAGPRPKPVPRGELGTGRLRMTARPRG